MESQKTSNTSDMIQIIENISTVVGTNWNTNLAKTYIAATLHGYERGIKTLQKDLDFERAVNKRVDEIVKGLLGAKLED